MNGGMQAAAPAALLAIVFALIELVKFVSRRRRNGDDSGVAMILQRLETVCLEGNRRLELILQELRHDRETAQRHREYAIRAEERANQFRRRMEDHMEQMECVQRTRKDL